MGDVGIAGVELASRFSGTNAAADNRFVCRKFSRGNNSLKIPALHLERFDMEIRHEHIPWDDRLWSIA